jgi:membrane protein implicated in regulation of membrane protease activity
MTDQESRFSSYSRTYRPWGQVRRQNLIGRIVHGMLMTALGLGALAALALLFIFAASVAVVGVVALALVAIAAFVRRTPAKIFVRTDRSAKGVYEARKKGSTWVVY